AVVLGGTSIFGGRGSIVGTLLGLFAIAVLQNGLRLADLPAELAGVLTGTLLLLAIGLDRRPVPGRLPPTHVAHEGEFIVKNSQVAAVCPFLLLAALIIAASNVYLASAIRRDRAGDGAGSVALPAAITTAAVPSGGREITVAMMPKSKGNAYFIA